jgi:methyl-accepting chemotaxis protein
MGAEFAVQRLIAKINIGPRLIAGFILIVLLMLCVAAIGIWGLRSLHLDMRYIVEVQNPRIAHINAISEEAGAIAIAVRDALAAEAEDSARPHIARVESGRKTMGDLLAKLDNTVTDDSDGTKQTQDALHSAYGAYTIEQVKLTRAIAAGKKELAQKVLFEGAQPKLQSYLAALTQLREHEAGAMRASEENARLSYERGRTTIVAILLLAAALTGVLAYVLTRSITRPLQYASLTADAIARGDLTRDIQVRGTDETAVLTRSLSAMQAQLVSIVGQIKTASDAVHQAAGEIARGNTELSRRTESHAASLQQTAASVESLTGTVKHNADRARQAAQRSGEASAVAGQGGEVVAQVEKTMHSINDDARHISDMLGIINSIAFQTNILALNAAVEAARAGEQGRGFAVVATEVRNLAQRSADAAKDIKTLIANSAARVHEGSAQVARAAATMAGVVSSVKHVSDLIAEIATASHQQSVSVDQVSNAISHMDAVTQQNAAMVEESSAAADHVEDQAIALVQAVAAFKLREHDATGLARANLRQLS